jgi:cell division inhibitor SepF
MSVFKKAMNYLGLGPEDAYDDYDVPMEPDRPVGRPSRPVYGHDEPTVRPVSARGSVGREPVPRAVPSMGEMDGPAVSIRTRHQASAVRTVPNSTPSRPHTVKPRRFDQAQEVADRFKEGQPVIVNIEGVDRDLSRRLIDFASGLCYGLGGTMEKVASGVYLLTPVNATVSAEDKRIIGEAEYDD